MLGSLMVALLMALGSLAAGDQSSGYDCLPKDVRPDEVVTFSRNPKDNVTVVRKLDELKAKCRNKKLVDSRNKEIRFFRVSCWGNPPPNYLDLRQKEKTELEQLRKKYTVVTFGCNPRTP